MTTPPGGSAESKAPDDLSRFARDTPDEPFDKTDAAERAGGTVDWIDYYRRGLDNDPANYGACRD